MMLYNLFIMIVFLIVFTYDGRNNTAPMFFASAIISIYYYFQNSDEYFQISIFSWGLSLIGFIIVSFTMMYFVQKRIENVYKKEHISNILPRYPAIVAILVILAFTGWSYYNGFEKIDGMSSTIIWITTVCQYAVFGYMITWFILSWWLFIGSFVPKILKND